MEPGPELSRLLFRKTPDAWMEAVIEQLRAHIQAVEHKLNM